MRLSDAEREQLYERLSAHAAAGRLDIPELERRVALVAAAETREEAVAALADLPPLPAPRTPRTSRTPRTNAGAGGGGGGVPRRGQGHGDAAAPEVDWRPTPERFRDPRTHRVVRVWEDAAGGRHYVAEDEA